MNEGKERKKERKKDEVKGMKMIRQCTREINEGMRNLSLM